VNTLTKDVIYHRGRSVAVFGVQIDDKRLIIQGKFLTMARLRDKWYFRRERGCRIPPDRNLNLEEELRLV
jgi:hypothetical protein